MAELTDFTLDLSQSLEINAAIGDVYQNLVRQLTERSSTPDNQPMPMVLEQWPGGRWFRDLGNGQGHLWGFVQVIKPPNLIEIHGPLFMSYAVAGHVRFQLTPVPGGTELAVRHCAVGMIQDDHRAGVMAGWQSLLDKVKRSS